MKMKKTLSLLLALAMALSLAACGAQPDASGSEPASQPEAVSEPASRHPGSRRPHPPSLTGRPETSYPVTVTDQAGRQVTIESQPGNAGQRLLHHHQPADRPGPAGRAGGHRGQGRHPAPSTPSARRSCWSCPAWAPPRSLTLEGCAAPGTRPGHPAPQAGKRRRQPGRAGHPRAAGQPGGPDPAERGRYPDRRRHHQPRPAPRRFWTSQRSRSSGWPIPWPAPRPPSVYLAGNSDFLSTAGDAMYQSDMIRMAGGVNAAAEITDTYWAEVSYEQVLAWDPDYIVLASDAGYTVDDVLAEPQPGRLRRGGKTGNVFQIPGDAEAWDSPVARRHPGRGCGFPACCTPTCAPEADSPGRDRRVLPDLLRLCLQRGRRRDRCSLTRTKIRLFCAAGAALLAVLAVASLFTGKYPAHAGGYAGRRRNAAAGVLDAAGQPDGGGRFGRLCAGRGGLCLPDGVPQPAGLARCDRRFLRGQRGRGGGHPVFVRRGGGHGGLLCGGRWPRWGWRWRCRRWTAPAGTAPSCWRASRCTRWRRPP